MPPYTHHNEGAGGCEGGSPKLLELKWLEADCKIAIKAAFQHPVTHKTLGACTERVA
jgi:hypothetical protein